MPKLTFTARDGNWKCWACGEDGSNAKEGHGDNHLIDITIGTETRDNHAYLCVGCISEAIQHVAQTGTAWGTDG